MDQDGAAWTVEQDQVLDDGDAVSGVDGDLSELALVDGRIVLVEEGPHSELRVRDPADGPVEDLGASGGTDGAVVAGDDGITWLVESSRNGNTTGPLRIWRNDGDGWTSETLDDRQADGARLAAAANGDELAFAYYEGTRIHLMLPDTAGGWTEADSVEAYSISGVTWGGDGGAWLAYEAGDPEDGAWSGEFEPAVLHAGDCNVRLGGLVADVALMPTEEGVAAIGFDSDGAPWRVEVAPGCATTATQLGEAMGEGLQEADLQQARSGPVPVVVGDFVTGKDGGGFDHPFVPLCY